MTALAPQAMLLSLDQIALDGGVWPRAALDAERVELFAELVRDARDSAGTGQGWTDPLPPLVVVADGRGGYVLADGRHRYEARRQLGAGFDLVQVQVFQPDGRLPTDLAYELALHFATISAKPLSNPEKRAAVDRLISERPELSSRQVARLVGVSHTFVDTRRCGNVAADERDGDRPLSRKSDPIGRLLDHGEPFALDEDLDVEALEDELVEGLLDRYPTHATEWAEWWAERFQEAGRRVR